MPDRQVSQSLHKWANSRIILPPEVLCCGTNLETLEALPYVSIFGILHNMHKVTK